MKTVTRISDLLVISLAKLRELIGTENTKDDIDILIETVAQKTGAANVLLTCGDCETTDIYFSSATHEKIGFKCTSRNKYSSESVATAIAANLSHGYRMAQAVYGGLEYIETCNTLAGKKCLKFFTYNIDIPLKHMLADENFKAHDLVSCPAADQIADPTITNDFYNYLSNHPAVKPSWERYINHDFVRQISENCLDPLKFKFYIEQDYAYLSDFCRIHMISGSKGPGLDEMEDELQVVEQIKGGLIMHKDRLRSYGIPPEKEAEYFSNLFRGPALQNYARYLKDVAARGNWKELVIATMPCLTGYVSAAIPYEGKVKAPKDSMYYEWMDVYYSPWVKDAKTKGKQTINKVATGCTNAEIERLVQIYAEVCELEAQFWDAALYLDTK
ncbi:uncharacterized protein KNAG_0G02170 [Huiozyma naganishii CBS 8797]|uniref:Thiaminase-2/PQQC domain-containing protein n=1 Tax=Huiozyma naganishii (strain ATCC MYA-139 / BCRC 22969 / CBS 8797 / KCTC 17520 / NBRC 10181 / NCYC 3082 / Yp74L-3) TaxID=1071383 RepID=J7R8S8_HUIN7|nr:hypothetical protein KNAG_0G02170 [Kazachstania naganishii CBS 8797]CCK71275.1 hypothetical protein KNAG_0G02170 [Kazachstania naganishii CBS 8797]